MKELEGKGIVNVASGGNFYLALSSNGQLYGWGKVKYNRFGVTS
jgi:alpha-tubulin suppressor-like RCC1 family protein